MAQLLAWREETPEQLAALVSSQRKLLIMTDYDGTLVSLKETPEQALPGPGLIKILKRFAQKSYRDVLAIISGRDVADLKKMLPINGIYFVGCHGAEYIYPDDRRFILLDVEKLSPVLDEILEKAIQCTGRFKGFITERKTTAFALHYRLASPDASLKVIGKFIEGIRPLLPKHNLELLFGKKVIEVRPKGIDKGAAVRRLIQDNPDFYPIYFGDDTTDEDAFKSVLKRGIGVLVSENKKITAASYRLRHPRDVLRFLQIVSARC